MADIVAPASYVRRRLLYLPLLLGMERIMHFYLWEYIHEKATCQVLVERRARARATVRRLGVFSQTAPAEACG